MQTTAVVLLRGGDSVAELTIMLNAIITIETKTCPEV